MKKLAIISAIAFSGLLYNTANAQFGVHIGIRLFPHRGAYAPAPVEARYINDDDFYYLPDVGAYYSVVDQLYYYFDGQEWISAAYLPGVYHDYDWRYARRFEIREARPYLRNDFYRNRYQGFDNDLAHNHDHFREGFDFRQNRDAYNEQRRFDNQGYDQRFDNNRGGNNQHFDNKGDNNQKFDNRGNNDQRFDDRNHSGYDKQDNGGNRDNRGGLQFDQNQYKGNDNGKQSNNDYGRDKSYKQDRIAQNDKGYDGHKDAIRDRF